MERAGLADRALGQQGRDAADDGVEPHPHGLHEEQSACFGQGDELGGGGGVDGERLLEQDRFALFEGGPGECGVRVVGGGDVDELDLVGLDEPGDVEGLGDGVGGGERLGALGAAAGDGDQFGLLAEREVRGDGLAHPAGADHADAKRSAVHSGFLLR